MFLDYLHWGASSGRCNLSLFRPQVPVVQGINYARSAGMDKSQWDNFIEVYLCHG